MRWLAEITYMTDAGQNVVQHDVEELEDLHDIVERGPDWNAIDEIKVTLQRRSYSKTVEETEAL